jgi:hypothetical protein
VIVDLDGVGFLGVSLPALITFDWRPVLDVTTPFFFLFSARKASPSFLFFSPNSLALASAFARASFTNAARAFSLSASLRTSFFFSRASRNPCTN